MRRHSEAHRQKLRERGVRPVLAKRRTEHGSGLGMYRWVVERTHAWFQTSIVFAPAMSDSPRAMKPS